MEETVFDWNAQRKTGIPKWSEVRGGSQSPTKKRSQQLLRKALPGFTEPVVCKARPGQRAEIPVPLRSTHEARVETRPVGAQRRHSTSCKKKRLGHVGGPARKAKVGATNMREDIVEVVALSQKQNGQNIFRLTTGGPDSDCVVKLACKEGGNQPRRRQSAATKTDGPYVGQKRRPQRQGRWTWKRRRRQKKWKNYS